MPSASLTQTCADVTVVATALGPRTVAGDQTCAPAEVVSTAFLGRVGASNLQTANAKTEAMLTLGDRPEFPVVPVQAKVYNLTGQVRDSGGAILCFVGPPWKTIDWRVVQGHGTLTPFTTFTDGLGRCSCRYDAAGFAETVVIGAAYVP